MLKILSIGTDRNLFRVGSAVSNRVAEQGTVVGELHVIVFALRSLGLKERLIAPNVWVHPTNSLSRWFYIFDAVRIGRNIAADVITTQDPFECGLAGLFIKNRTNAALEVQIHTDLFSPHFKGVINKIRKIISQYVIPLTNAVRVVSDGIGTKVKHPNVYTLPVYIDKSRISGEIKFDLHDVYGFKHVALAVSRLSSEKNLSLAIEAVSRIPDFGLVIVGDGPDREKLEVMSRKIGDKVQFVGWKQDLSSYYKTADVFIQTSKYEGYGLSLVEARLSGLPIVSTPVGIAKELSNVILANTVEEFVKSLKACVKSDFLNSNQEIGAIFVTKEEYLSKLKENWLRIAHK